MSNLGHRSKNHFVSKRDSFFISQIDSTHRADSKNEKKTHSKISSFRDTSVWRQFFGKKSENFPFGIFWEKKWIFVCKWVPWVQICLQIWNISSGSFFTGVLKNRNFSKKKMKNFSKFLKCHFLSLKMDSLHHHEAGEKNQKFLRQLVWPQNTLEHFLLNGSQIFHFFYFEYFRRFRHRFL